MEEQRNPTANHVSGPMSRSGAALSRLARTPLSQQVADEIVEAVAAGAIRPGQRVTDSDIALKLGVSRNPVREAMKILEAQGIIVSTPHRSTHVVAFDMSKVDQIANARVAIERIAFGEAASAYTDDPGLIRELDRIVEAMEEAALRNDLNGITKADLAFHRAVCVASRNEIILTLWETIARHMRISFNLEIEEDTAPPEDIPRHHRALRDALARGDRSEVEREIESHILRLRHSRQRAAVGK
ncbi:MAG: GntR family transcriptional regulator [Dongiaceae bacterium]